MKAKKNGFWDFKSYNESTWFRSLISLLCAVIISYVSLHVILNDTRLSFEYTKLNQDQMQVISRIYMDSPGMPSKPVPKKGNGRADSLNPPPGQTVPSPLKLVAAKDSLNTVASKTKVSKKDTCYQDTCPCIKVISYLKNIFDNQLDSAQAIQIQDYLRDVKPQEATAFLNTARFKVRSYFWLIGPSVYWEIVFWALFGVLCNLLFILGAVGSDATTDLGNPRTTFDSSEIYGQVARILYAPICTLAVVLGYNFFKDQNIVDIDSSKGLIVFAFIGGFYSSRVISLMDRLKDVLLPNSGTSSLPTTNSPGANAVKMIQQLRVQLSLDHGVAALVAEAAVGTGLNAAIVKLQVASDPTSLTATRNAGDPNGLWTFTNVQPGNYIVLATLTITPQGETPVTLKGQISGKIMTGTAPIEIALK